MPQLTAIGRAAPVPVLHFCSTSGDHSSMTAATTSKAYSFICKVIYSLPTRCLIECQRVQRKCITVCCCAQYTGGLEIISQ
ncbi:unnamed protein product [Urochloa humidicola]